MTEFPTVPEDRLTEEGWERIDETSDTLARLPAVEVRGHTLVYGDRRLRERIRSATDLDRPWRFFFATRLTLKPSLPPGIGPTMIGSIVRSRAKDGFESRLRDRGFERIERGRTDRIRVGTGENAELTAFEATSTLEGDRAYPVEGYLAVWHHNGTFRIAGGAYPAANLSTVLDAEVDADPGDFREELLGLLRNVA